MLIAIVPFIIAYHYCLHYTTPLDLVGAKKPRKGGNRSGVHHKGQLSFGNRSGAKHKCIGTCSPKKVFYWIKSKQAQHGHLCLPCLMLPEFQDTRWIAAYNRIDAEEKEKCKAKRTAKQTKAKDRQATAVAAFQSLVEEDSPLRYPSKETWTSEWRGLSGMDLLRHASTVQQPGRHPDWPDPDETCFYHCTDGGNELYEFEWLAPPSPGDHHTTMRYSRYNQDGSTERHLMPQCVAPSDRPDQRCGVVHM
jgi:hypothetical protein